MAVVSASPVAADTRRKRGYGRFSPLGEGRYAQESISNIALVLLDRGHVSNSYFASHCRAVDGNSLFQDYQIASSSFSISLREPALPKR